MKLNFSLFCLLSIFVLIFGCRPENVDPACLPVSGSLTNIPYLPVPASAAVPVGFPQMEVPPDNPLTIQGVELGRKLFYDPILSADSTQSCFSCHQQSFGFADGLGVSDGIDGISGKRSSMPLINLAFNHQGFFWDGRSASLEEQALLPVEDSVELHNDWDDLICKLTQHDTYPRLFREAFGIEDKIDITKELAAKAIAQFERTIISGNSKYDKFLRGEVFLSDEELNGHDMFFDLAMNKVRFPDSECAHCHGSRLLTINEFRNNGSQEAATLADFEDAGLGGITGNLGDNGKFRIPTLRNIEMSGPYMHDGQFETLEEVIEHYSSGGLSSPNTDPLIYPLNLDAVQKAELLAFLKTLTDTTSLNSPAYSNPF